MAVDGSESEQQFEAATLFDENGGTVGIASIPFQQKPERLLRFRGDLYMMLGWNKYQRVKPFDLEEGSVATQGRDR